jgi:hypothetical protein
MTSEQEYRRRIQMLDTDRYAVKVIKSSTDGEHIEREVFSGEAAGTFMGDGGERFIVPGLGHGKPDVMEKYDIIYPKELAGVYGTVSEIGYARSKAFERLTMDVCQVGSINVIRQQGKFRNGPGWWTQDIALAGVTLGVARTRGLDKIISQLPRKVAGMIEALEKEYR